MQKSTLPQGIKTLKGWYQEKQQLKFDLPVQRNAGQWNNLQKSLLIHSLLSAFPIPPIYLIKEKIGEEGGKDCFLYQALDGKQRLTSIFEFIDGEYALNATTPEAEVDGTAYDLSGLKFDALSEECQDEILGYRLTIYNLENCTDEEIEEVFARLNNSTPLTSIQKSRTVMGSELAQWTKDLCNSDFFTQSVNLTLAQVRKEADLEVLLQSMLLLEARHENYEYKAISVSEVTNFCTYIHDAYCDNKRLMILEILEYLSKVFPTQHKFLKKSNAPMVIVLSKLALENNIEADCFKTFIDSFSNAICPAYEENTGSGNTKREKTQGRLKSIAGAFANYFSLSGVNIISAEEIVNLPENFINGPFGEDGSENFKDDLEDLSRIEEEDKETEKYNDLQSEGVSVNLNEAEYD